MALLLLWYPTWVITTATRVTRYHTHTHKSAIQIICLQFQLGTFQCKEFFRCQTFSYVFSHALQCQVIMGLLKRWKTNQNYQQYQWSVMSGREFTGTQKHALQVKINNNWPNITHSTSLAAVMKQNCEATIQFGKNDMIHMCVCVWGGEWQHLHMLQVPQCKT